MNRAKNRRIYHKEPNTLNFNIYPKVKINLYTTRCFRENENNETRKYATKQTECCPRKELYDTTTNKSKIPNRLFKDKLYNPPKIQRIYKDPKSQCAKNKGKNDYNCSNRKRIQNRGGCIKENYNYSSSNYLHKLKQKMKNKILVKKNDSFIKNINLKDKHKKTKLNNCDISNCSETNWFKNNKKIRTCSNYTQKIGYSTSLIADIKKKYTPNVSYAMDYTNTFPKQNQYPCYNSKQAKNPKSSTKGIPIVGTYVEYKNGDSKQKGLILKVNYNMFSENTYNILLDNDANIVSNINREKIRILDIQQVKELKKDFCYTKKDKCNPCKSCN